MSLQSLIRKVLPKEESFYALLEKLAVLTSASVLELRRLGVDGATPEEVAARVQDVEHTADAVFHEVESGLARTFVTPIDREDIHQVAFELDDIVDMVNLSARACSLFRVAEFTPAMSKQLDALEQCTGVLTGALPKLRRHDYAGIIADGRKIRLLEKDADAVFRRTLSALFDDPSVDPKRLLKWREITDHLEDAVNRCNRLGKTLANLAVKHG